jgi:transcriptional regulator with XRE-family HTH domain
LAEHGWSKGAKTVAREATAAGFDPERLREARIHAGLTQAELAHRAGIHHTAIARYESGDRTPYVERLATLAAALGLTPAALTNNRDTGNLAQLRNAAGLSQDTAARHAGLIRTTYAAIERGEVASLDPDVTNRLAAALNVDPKAIRTAHSISRANHLQRSD